MESRRADVAFWGVCAAAVAASLALELPYLSDRAMHRDEALDLMIARRPIGDLLETVQLVRGGAPLHFVLSSLIAQLGGGLAATRLLSALALAAAVVGVGLLGRALFSAVEGAGAAVAVALCPVALFYGDFARMYTLFLALSSFALWCLVRALDDGSPRYWAGLAAFLVVDVYAHPYGVVVGLIAAITAIVALVRRHDRSAWRRPLIAAAAVVLATAPLGVGYLVLASRLHGVHATRSAPIQTPPTLDTLYQAFANFLGAPRAQGSLVWGVFLVVCAALVVVGLVMAARDDVVRGVFLVLWLVLPALVLVVVHVPGTDNHVRYVIEALPAVVLLVLHGARRVGGLVSGRAALVAALVAAVALAGVELGRGRHLSDYLYRGVQTAAERDQASRTAAFLRATFASGDVFFGYDPAWGYGVINAGSNRWLASARGVARSEGPLIQRSLQHLTPPFGHGWYVALVPRRPRFSGTLAGCGTHRAAARRFADFQAALGSDLEATRIGGWALVRTREPGLGRRSFAQAGQRVFAAAGACLGDPQAPTTETALTDALSGLQD